MKLYKRSYPLSFGDRVKLQNILKELGYSREVVADIFEYQNSDYNNVFIQKNGLPEKCSASKISYPAESTFSPEDHDQRSRDEFSNSEESQHPKQINSNYINFSFCTEYFYHNIFDILNKLKIEGKRILKILHYEKHLKNFR